MDDDNSRLRREIGLRRQLRRTNSALTFAFPAWLVAMGFGLGVMVGGPPNVRNLALAAVPPLAAFCALWSALALRLRTEKELARTLRP